MTVINLKSNKSESNLQQIFKSVEVVIWNLNTLQLGCFWEFKEVEPLELTLLSSSFQWC